MTSASGTGTTAGPRHGAHLVVDPESFLVTKESHLEPHEAERARAWGEALRAAMVTAAT